MNIFMVIFFAFEEAKKMIEKKEKDVKIMAQARQNNSIF